MFGNAQPLGRVLVVLLGVAVAVTACGVDQTEEEKSVLDTVLERGHVIQGVSSELPPLGFTDDQGQLQGFDIDIGHIISQQLFNDPSKVEFQKTAMDARFESVQSGLIDFGMIGTTITGERALRVAFTTEYLDSGFGVLVLKDSPIETFEELNNPDITIALQDQANAREAKDRFFPEAQEFIGSGEADLVLALQAGRADAAFQGKISALYYTTKADDVRYLEEELFPPTRYGFFVRSGDFKWWKFLDEVAKELRAGGLYNQYAEIHRKWLGKDPPVLTPQQ